MAIEVVGLDHIYISVKSLARSEEFYDRVMALLDFRKGTDRIGNEAHVHYFNPALQLSIRPARSMRAHDPYVAGLHHFCLRVRSSADVDATVRGLRDLGIAASEPRVYPEYSSDYYATFFEDPDGIRLEVVAETAVRRVIRDHWSELTEFENPLSKAGLTSLAQRR